MSESKPSSKSSLSWQAILENISGYEKSYASIATGCYISGLRMEQNGGRWLEFFFFSLKMYRNIFFKSSHMGLCFESNSKLPKDFKCAFIVGGIGRISVNPHIVISNCWIIQMHNPLFEILVQLCFRIWKFGAFRPGTWCIDQMT